MKCNKLIYRTAIKKITKNLNKKQKQVIIFVEGNILNTKLIIDGDCKNFQSISILHFIPFLQMPKCK